MQITCPIHLTPSSPPVSPSASPMPSSSPETAPLTPPCIPTSVPSRLSWYGPNLFLSLPPVKFHVSIYFSLHQRPHLRDRPSNSLSYSNIKDYTESLIPYILLCLRRSNSSSFIKVLLSPSMFHSIPETLKDDLIRHISEVRSFYDQDRKENLSGVWLPGALEKKYPNAGKEWGWFWLFPSKSLSVDPRTLAVRRHHMHPASLQKAFKTSVIEAGLPQ